MGAEEINFMAVPAALLLALIASPIVFRRAAYPMGKTVFGTMAIAIAALGIAGIITVVQRKTGLEALPLAWLAPAAVAVFLHRLRAAQPKISQPSTS